MVNYYTIYLFVGMSRQIFFATTVNLLFFIQTLFSILPHAQTQNTYTRKLTHTHRFYTFFTPHSIIHRFYTHRFYIFFTHAVIHWKWTKQKYSRWGEEDRESFEWFSKVIAKQGFKLYVSILTLILKIKLGEITQMC